MRNPKPKRRKSRRGIFIFLGTLLSSGSVEALRGAKRTFTRNACDARILNPRDRLCNAPCMRHCKRLTYVARRTPHTRACAITIHLSAPHIRTFKPERIRVDAGFLSASSPASVLAHVKRARQSERRACRRRHASSPMSSRSNDRQNRPRHCPHRRVRR